MKGHTVPWAFLPKEIQAILAIVFVAVVIKHTYADVNMVRRWWPWTFAVAAVLLAPLSVAWAGFGPQGPMAESLAAELQSLAVSVPWAAPVVSALQSIGTKGMGLKTAGVLLAAGGTLVRGLLVLELIPAPPALQQEHVRPVAQGRQPAPQERQLRQGAEAQQQQQHPHGE